MKLNTLFTKVTALILSLGLLMPNPAYAARQVSTVDSPVLGQLTAALAGGAGLGSLTASALRPEEAFEKLRVIRRELASWVTDRASLEANHDSLHAQGLAVRLIDSTPAELLVIPVGESASVLTPKLKALEATRVLEQFPGLFPGHPEVLTPGFWENYYTVLHTATRSEARGINVILKQIIVDQLKIDPVAVTPEADWVGDLGADDRDLFEIQMAIEEKFGWSIPDHDVESLGLDTASSIPVNLQKIKDYLMSKGVSETGARSEARMIVKDESILAWKSKHGKSLKQILDQFVKEYDFRGFDGADDVNFPQQVDEELLRWVGNALASVNFNSRRHKRNVQLKAGDTFVIAGDNGPSTQKFKNALIQGLRDAGVNVIDLGVTVSGHLYKSISNLGAQGGLYVTRSHVEVGTNGAKPNIGGITLYGDMLQQAKTQILNGQYAKAEQLGTLNVSEAVRDQSREMYLGSLMKGYGDLAALAKSAGMKIAFNLNSGSATGYVPFFQKMFGEDVTLLKSEGDPWARKGLADPSRKDKKALAHPDANMVQYSKDHPDVLVLSFDLDVDRVSLLMNGELYLGDEMFYAVIEYLLTLDPYKDLLKKIFPDSRMKIEFGQMVRYFGGVAKRHPKGHSKVKATIDLLFEQLVKESGYPDKAAFLAAHPGFRFVQSEYSLHFFLTSDKGEAFDDALEFSLFWLTVFAKIKLAHHRTDWSYADYIRDLKDKGIITESIQIKEQRTPTPDEVKGAVMDQMKDAVVESFKGRTDFEYVPNWEDDYEGEMKPYTLINIEGVYHLVAPMGEIFWGQSNTSPKVAFGAQSTSVEDTRKLAGIVSALMIRTREKVAPQAPKFQSLEMSELFNAWLPETHKLSYEDWEGVGTNGGLFAPVLAEIQRQSEEAKAQTGSGFSEVQIASMFKKAKEKMYEAWLSDGLEANVLAAYPTVESALAEFKPVRSDVRDVHAEGTEVYSVDFAKVIGSTPLFVEGASMAVRKALTSNVQEPLLITPEFAFDTEMAGLPLIPAIAGGNPVVVIARNPSEVKMVTDFNASLPAGVSKLLIAGNPEEGLELLRQKIAELVRSGAMKVGVKIRAIATPSSGDIALLKQAIGDQWVFVATQGWVQKTASVAGLTAVVQSFAAALALGRSA